jgi:hypothetical protein
MTRPYRTVPGTVPGGTGTVACATKGGFDDDEWRTSKLIGEAAPRARYD